MFYIIETESQLQRLENLGKEGAYLEIITSNDRYHSLLSYLVAVYIRPLLQNQGYIIPLAHDEGINIDFERVCQVLSHFNNLYVFNKKEVLRHLPLKDAKDLSLIYSMQKYDKLLLPNQNNTVDWFYRKFERRIDINSFIPITKLYERCEHNFNTLEHVIDLDLPPGFDFYNNTATGVFYLVENEGIQVLEESFIEKFTPRYPTFNMKDGRVFTDYNLYNTTSRPTNSFNSVNFAALPKSQEHRKCFVPKNDLLVELDYDGYHLRLICDRVGYELSEESAHKQVARLCFGKENISDEDYAKIKQINFHAIYGSIPPEYRHVDLFQKIEKFTQNLWKTYKSQGWIENPISGKRFTSIMPDMNPQKLMNYYIQSLETARNVIILKELLRYLKDKKSRVILYVYDAFILDYSLEDGEETLEYVRNILEENKKYPIKLKQGRDLFF